MNLYKRSCYNCKCDVFLDKKETYISKNPTGIRKLISRFKIVETRFFCIPCDRDIKIKSIVKN